jgi:transposase-like protein
MPKKYPPEFKRDVVTVARRGDLSVAEVAVDFGVGRTGGGRTGHPKRPRTASH